MISLSSIAASSHCCCSIFSSSRTICPSISLRSDCCHFSLVLPRAVRREPLLVLRAKKRPGSETRPRKQRRRRKPKLETSGNAGVAEESELEAEIFDFMEKSLNPSRFPKKEELIAAGRADLVKAITERGGWLTYGWNLDENKEAEAERVLDSASEEREMDGRVFQQRLAEGSHDVAAEADSKDASSSGRSQFLDMGDAEDGGIEGILRRLKKERSVCYAVGHGDRKAEGDEILSEIAEENSWESSPDVARPNGSSSSFASTSFSFPKGLCSDSSVQRSDNCSDFEGISSFPEKSMWRTRSAQRAGCTRTEFEAAEIVPSKGGNQWMRNFSSPKNVDITDNMYKVTDSIQNTAGLHNKEALGYQQSFQGQIRSHLQHLQSELNSVLHLLRTRSDNPSYRGQGSDLNEMRELSDALEFQETEIMKTRAKLRSTRAKLAILEGKMALELIDIKKIVQEREKTINDAKKALSILQTAYVVWPSPAKEVFLTGSFDGWTSKRRMERTSAGVFSLKLMLYPGRYEIKFIVDGVWKVDALRQITSSNGYENNVLTVP